MWVVESWEAPVQRQLASEALRSGGRILEVGYGLGMCAQAIAAGEPTIHTVIEAHPIVASWAQDELLGTRSSVLIEFWEDVLPQLDSAAWDAVVFDAYPLDVPEFQGSPEEILHMVLPALASAARALRNGGRFLFLDFTEQLESSSQSLREAVRDLFVGGIETSVVSLQIPQDCGYASGTKGVVIALVK